MKEEQKYFDVVIKYVNQKLNLELASFDELQYNYRRHPEMYATAYSIALKTLKVLKNGIKKPYFARIDFSMSDSVEKIYIGKYGIFADNSEQLVVDWRAPISSLYYDSELGKASYECPEGIKNGELILKRQFDIEDGILKGFHDIDLVSSDELLQKYLNENNDIRLKNIVSTIQKEQNEAIRKPINKNIIVQGVAGSGKTTIALHRIAYLVYNNRNKIMNNQYLVIGPNKVFLNYIKSVLPDLDVDDIEQETFEDFAKTIIEDEINVKSSVKYLTQHLIGKELSTIPKFKNSLQFKEMLKKYMDEYLNSFCTTDFIIKDFKICNKEQMKDIWNRALVETGTFDSTINRFILLATKYIENNINSITSAFEKQKYEKFDNSINQKEIAKIKSDASFVSEELEKCCKSSLRKYVLKSKVSAVKLYQKFILNIKKYDCYNYENINELKALTLDNIKNNSYDFEDLAPLMYIKYRLGIDIRFSKYRHAVIDEAQDLGEFNFYMLKKSMPKSTFSIFGDIAQSIYDYRSIDSWEQVLSLFENSELLKFNKSYRTTDQIMEVANAVSQNLNIEPSELSVRQGENITINKVEKENIPLYMKEKIEQYKNEGYKTIAIISKYPLQSSYLNDYLSFEGVFIPNVDENTDVTKINNQAVTISNYLSKGLEFDVVIINDATEDIYNSNSPSDLKMLYVALTRALHKLDITYSGELTHSLKQFVNDKGNQKIYKK